MAKRSTRSRSSALESGVESSQPGSSDKIELQKEAVPLDQRLVSGRSVPIETVRQKAKIEVGSYSKDPEKYLAKIKRGNVLVAQELVSRGEYAVDQVRTGKLGENFWLIVKAKT